jgi:hypothetical protein
MDGEMMVVETRKLCIEATEHLLTAKKLSIVVWRYIGLNEQVVLVVDFLGLLDMKQNSVCQ